MRKGRITYSSTKSLPPPGLEILKHLFPGIFLMGIFNPFAKSDWISWVIDPESVVTHIGISFPAGVDINPFITLSESSW